jgi:hypothetical protein
MSRPPAAATALGLALALAGGAALASNCDSIRERIESRLRAAGVANYALETVDANATTTGRTVGTCEQGAKKILYSRPGPPSSAPAPQADRSPKPRPGTEALLTECRDGSTTLGGDCPK